MMHPQKVIARIEGGLGNQLFQYATARSLADRLNCELALDLRGLNENGDRPFQLSLYKTRAHIASDQELADLPDPRSTRWGRIRSRLSHLIPTAYSYPIFWARSFAFDSRFEKIVRPVFLVGYWQSEKYFSWNRYRLLQDLQLRTPLPDTTRFLQKIRSTRSVALHIRRGDYVTNAAAASIHGVCDISYYQHAAKSLISQFSDIQFFIFSDDLDWAKTNLMLNAPSHYVDIHTSDTGHLDLELMRQCRHHIIANSTFSWWGAWLCTLNEQVVYAPNQWFASSRADTSDIIPARWNHLS